MHFKKRQISLVGTAGTLSLVPITKGRGSKDPHPLKSTLVRAAAVGQLRSQYTTPVGGGSREKGSDRALEILRTRKMRR